MVNDCAPLGLRKDRVQKHKEKLEQFGRVYSAILDFGARTQDLRKVAILEAVIEILATDGVDELTFERIGKRVGMARSHVVYYFKNREALVESAMRFVALTAQQVIAEKLLGEKEWTKLLRRYVEANFDWIGENRDHSAVFLLMYYRAATRKNYRKMHSDFREAGTQRIRNILKLRPQKWDEKELQSVSKGIQGIITGNLVDVMSTDLADDFKLRRQQTLEMVERLVGLD